MLVVSDPPHGDVKVEAVAVAMGLPAEHARLKVLFGAPEVLGATDLDRATDMAASLRAAGLSVQLLDGAQLTQVPWPTLVSSVDVGDDGLRVALPDRVVELAYRDPVFAVLTEPPPSFTPPRDAPSAVGDVALTGAAAADVLEWAPHVDLYFSEGATPGRLSFAGEQAESVVDASEGRFTALTVDARLVGVRPRRRFVAGDHGFNPDQRKRYAYGTLLLRHALESISPDLRDLTQYELGSRLAYLLYRGRSS